MNEVKTNMAEKNTFGEFLKQKRTDCGKTLRGFAAELGIAPAYLSDIEKGNRNPPEKYLQKMIELLKLTDTDVDTFYDLASVGKNGVYLDITEYIENTDTVRVALRRARDKNIQDDFWKDVLDQINKE